jgi:glucose-1-phosphate adenylyltransferase
MVEAGERVFAYPFGGYWKDVGTVQSLWQANMDLLGDTPVLDLKAGPHSVFCRASGQPPLYVGAGAILENAIVSDGCVVKGRVEHSVLSTGVKVEEGAAVRHSVLMGNVTVPKGAVVEYAVVSEGAVIPPCAHVGDASEANESIAVVGSGAESIAKREEAGA